MGQCDKVRQRGCGWRRGKRWGKMGWEGETLGRDSDREEWGWKWYEGGGHKVE